MKTFKEFMSNADPYEQREITDLDDQSLEALLNEGFVSGAIVAAKLNSMKNRVLSEDDPKKQNDELARMLHFGLGTIALVTNNRRGRR